MGSSSLLMRDGRQNWIERKLSLISCCSQRVWPAQQNSKREIKIKTMAAFIFFFSRTFHRKREDRPPSSQNESWPDKFVSGLRYLTTVIGKVTRFFLIRALSPAFRIFLPFCLGSQTVAISGNKSNPLAYHTHIWITAYCNQMMVTVVMFLLTLTKCELDLTPRCRVLLQLHAPQSDICLWF